MNNRNLLIFAFLCSLILCQRLCAQSNMEALQFNSNNQLLQGLFKSPIIQGNKQFPLIIWLHGSGECGNDNKKQFCNGIEYLDSLLDTQKYQAFLYAPQCPEQNQWSVYQDKFEIHQFSDSATKVEVRLMQTIEYLTKKHPIDQKRIYLIGLSMGGYAVWDLLARYPGQFAAGIPICGGGDPKIAKLYCNSPVWAFHGKRDDIVNVENTIQIIDAIKSQECQIDTKMTIYPDQNHGCWGRAVREPGMLDWLFSKSLY